MIIAFLSTLVSRWHVHAQSSGMLVLRRASYGRKARHECHDTLPHPRQLAANTILWSEHGTMLMS